MGAETVACTKNDWAIHSRCNFQNVVFPGGTKTAKSREPGSPASTKACFNWPPTECLTLSAISARSGSYGSNMLPQDAVE